MASTNASSGCFVPMKATSNGVWQHDNPIHFSFPLLIVQIVLVVVVTRVLAFFLKPLREPRVIGEIIGGILLGPTALGRNSVYSHKIFPKQSIPVLETVANMGLLFFLFMVGLELDLRALRRIGPQALSISIAGIALPFAGGAAVAVVFHNTIVTTGRYGPFLVFMGVAMSITAFPVLARILADRKLLTTDVGQVAMSAAAVDDVAAWILLALAVALSGTGNTSPVSAVWTLLCGIAFVIFMFVVTRPFMTWLANQSPDNEPIKEIYVCVTLILVLVSGFVTDVIGIHSIFGGFVLGLVIPKHGSFAHSLIEKLEDFVSVLLLPLYFASSGLKTDIGAVHGAQSWGLLVLVIVVAVFGKITGVVFVSQFYVKDFRKSLTLGVLMSTKGLVELIVLNIGRDRGVLNDEVFAIMVLMALFTTFITTPIVMAIYKPARNHTPYTRRQLYQDVSPKDDLRILTCVHGIRNIPAMINLTETVRGQAKSTLRLYILHLMELTERSSAIMMVQRARRDGRPFWDETGAGRTDRIVVGFEAFGQLSKVTVRPMTAISGFEDMHEDICSTAEDKRASIIILPFHKHLRFDGAFENGPSGFRTVNRKVLVCAPCSVGILIDRGLWGAAQVAPSNIDHTAVVLFFGGADDREALAFGIRMAEHPGVKLKVMRYTGDLDLDVVEPVPSGTSAQASRLAPGTSVQSGRIGTGTSIQSGRLSHSAVSSRHYFATPEADSVLERQRDEALLTAVRDPKETNTDRPFIYEEIEISDLTESVLAVGKVNDHHLILVGRNRRPSPLLAALAHRRHAEYAELGPVGDILTSSHCRSSVLVVQQYDPNLLHVPVHSSKLADGKDSQAGSSRRVSASVRPSPDTLV